jgi:hypothetical protein
VLEVLRAADLSAVHPVLVTTATGLDLLDVRVGLALLAGQVVDPDLCVPSEAVDAVALRSQGRYLLGLGEGRQAVPKLVEPGVELLDVEQLQLCEGVGFQRVLPLVGGWFGGGTCVSRCGSSTGR